MKPEPTVPSGGAFAASQPLAVIPTRDYKVDCPGGGVFSQPVNLPLCHVWHLVQALDSEPVQIKFPDDNRTITRYRGQIGRVEKGFLRVQLATATAQTVVLSCGDEWEDDEPRSGMGPGQGGTPPNVPLPTQTIAGPVLIDVPQGMATLRLAVQQLLPGVTLVGLDNSNQGIGAVSRLIFLRPNGSGRQTLDYWATQGYMTVFDIDVAGMTQVEIISTGGNATIKGAFSAAPCRTQLKSLLLVESDLGVTPGTDTIGATGSWAGTGRIINYPGAVSAKFAFVIQPPNAADTLVQLSANPIDAQGNVISNSNVHPVVNTGALDTTQPNGWLGVINWWMGEQSAKAVTTGQYGWVSPYTEPQDVSVLDWPGFIIQSDGSAGADAVILSAALTLHF